MDHIKKKLKRRLRKMQNVKPTIKYTALVHMMLREQKRQQNGEKYTAI